MKILNSAPIWSITAPVIGWVLLAAAGFGAGLGGSWTLVLAVAVTAIEVALIASLMIAGGEALPLRPVPPP